MLTTANDVDTCSIDTQKSKPLSIPATQGNISNGILWLATDNAWRIQLAHVANEKRIASRRWILDSVSRVRLILNIFVYAMVVKGVTKKSPILAKKYIPVDVGAPRPNSSLCGIYIWLIFLLMEFKKLCTGENSVKRMQAKYPMASASMKMILRPVTDHSK